MEHITKEFTLTSEEVDSISTADENGIRLVTTQDNFVGKQAYNQIIRQKAVEAIGNKSRLAFAEKPKRSGKNIAMYVKCVHTKKLMPISFVCAEHIMGNPLKMLFVVKCGICNGVDDQGDERVHEPIAQNVMPIPDLMNQNYLDAIDGIKNGFSKIIQRISTECSLTNNPMETLIKGVAKYGLEANSLILSVVTNIQQRHQVAPSSQLPASANLSPLHVPHIASYVPSVQPAAVFPLVATSSTTQLQSSQVPHIVSQTPPVLTLAATSSTTQLPASPAPFETQSQISSVMPLSATSPTVQLQTPAQALSTTAQFISPALLGFPNQPSPCGTFMAPSAPSTPNYIQQLNQTPHTTSSRRGLRSAERIAIQAATAASEMDTPRIVKKRTPRAIIAMETQKENIRKKQCRDI